MNNYFPDDLSTDEKQRLAELDLAEVRELIDGLVEAMGSAQDELYLTRIAALAMVAARQSEPAMLALLVAVAVDMLVQERAR